jgi:hypothetical protein
MYTYDVKTHNSIAMFFLKPYTLAGFEPGVYNIFLPWTMASDFSVEWQFSCPEQ